MKQPLQTQEQAKKQEQKVNKAQEKLYLSILLILNKLKSKVLEDVNEIIQTRNKKTLLNKLKFNYSMKALNESIEDFEEEYYKKTANEIETIFLDNLLLTLWIIQKETGNLHKIENIVANKLIDFNLIIEQISFEAQKIRLLTMRNLKDEMLYKENINKGFETIAKNQKTFIKTLGNEHLNLAILTALAIEQIDFYNWVTILDGKECDICNALDGLIINVKEKNAKLPPEHINCRCIITPVGVINPVNIDFNSWLSKYVISSSKE